MSEISTDFSKDQLDVISKAVKTQGLNKVVKRASEELLELSLALLHFDRNKADLSDILNEMADVRIVLKHLEIRFGNYQSQLDSKVIKGSTGESR